ncbi:MAG: FAD:protein FMN transferase [Acidobacteriota bacterium]
MLRRKGRRELLEWMSGKNLPPAELHLLRLGRPSMGSRLEVVIPARERGRVEEIQRILDEARRLESLLSYFDPYSTVSRLNREAAAAPIPVEPEVWGLLVLAKRIWEETEGAFDPAAGTLWRCWGFHQKQGRVPEEGELRRALAASGLDAVELDPERRTVRFLRPGIELNFGAIGKGYVLDCLRTLLQNAGFSAFLVHAGYSSVLARGEPAAHTGGWTVGLRNPEEPNHDVGRLRLRDVAMATSGSGEQHFVAEGRRIGHVLDPRTGWPVERHLAVTVLASGAAEADALSTAFFVMEAEVVRKFVKKRADLGVILVEKGASPATPEVEVLGEARRYWGERTLSSTEV